MKTLASFAPAGEPERIEAAKPESRAPKLTDLAHGRWLSFDPSLSHTGWVLAEYWGGELKIIAAETMTGKHPESATGWDKDFAAAEDIRIQVLSLLRDLGPSETNVVHEAPPTGGGKMLSPESAIQAALMIRRAVLENPHRRPLYLRPMVAPRSHKTVTGGSAQIKKAAHSKILKAYLEQIAPGSTKIITNEHEREAFSVMITDMVRMAKGE